MQGEGGSCHSAVGVQASGPGAGALLSRPKLPPPSNDVFLRFSEVTCTGWVWGRELSGCSEKGRALAQAPAGPVRPRALPGCGCDDKRHKAGGCAPLGTGILMRKREGRQGEGTCPLPKLGPQQGRGPAQKSDHRRPRKFPSRLNTGETAPQLAQWEAAS